MWIKFPGQDKSMKLFQINTTLNSGSTGRIAEEIGKLVMQQGDRSYIAFGKGKRPSISKTIGIGNRWNFWFHAFKTRLFDLHGFGSTKATRGFVEKVKEINPDIIHLHNIHGYYLNVEVLFNYLKKSGKPVVWTFHDCWPFTGHCSHFDYVNCFKWETQCFECPNKKGYPASWFIDNSKNNYRRKKELFTGLPNLKVVTPSKWLENHAKKSFLKEYPVKTIYNGVDLDVFKPVRKNKTIEKHKIENQPYIIGVANVWSQRKGLDDFISLRKILPMEVKIALVGLKENQIKKLPEGVIGIQNKENISELAALYSGASVFVNPTYVDNFPTTNIEALACGTPVVTYNTGGSPEAVDESTGMVVEKGNIKGLAEAINSIINNGKEHYSPLCRARAELYFNKDERFLEYIRLYKELFK